MLVPLVATHSRPYTVFFANPLGFRVSDKFLLFPPMTQRDYATL